MENIKVIKIDEAEDVSEISAVRQTLLTINSKIDQVVESNQIRMENAEETIKNLLEVISQKDKVIQILEAQQEELNRKGEGEKQLVNKLLGDIDRLNQDIGWYKKTYERRSLLGTIKQKLFNSK